MSTTTLSQSRESGVVSIFIVIFFMIFVSIISVGFIKIVNDDQSQATDSDLSARALASAQSGAEDGKRVLIYCLKNAGNPAIDTICQSVFNSPDCRAIHNNPAFTGTALNIDYDSTTGDGIAADNRDYEQFYTCMTIATKTKSVEGILVEKGTSELIPLDSGSNSFNNIRFSWHATATTRDGQLSATRSTLDLPAENLWRNASGNSYAAGMRLEFIAVPSSGSFTLDQIESNTRTVFVLPGSVDTPDAPVNLNTYDLRVADPNATPTIPEKLPVLATCNPADEYACKKTVQLVGSPSSPAFKYFLKVSSIYTSAHIKVELRNGNASVDFDNVQPVIDVTGRANDVFRRIQTRVQYDTKLFLPQYAIETGWFCKDMTVADTATASSDACNPGGALAASASGICPTVQHGHSNDISIVVATSRTIQLGQSLPAGCTY